MKPGAGRRPWTLEMIGALIDCRNNEQGNYPKDTGPSLGTRTWPSNLTPSLCGSDAIPQANKGVSTPAVPHAPYEKGF